MAPCVQIYNYKIFATSPDFVATDHEGSVAIQHALEDGVRIANCSWGAGAAGDGTSREAKACDNAWQFGMTGVQGVGTMGLELGA